MSTLQEQFANAPEAGPPTLGKWLMRLGIGLVLLRVLLDVVEVAVQYFRPDLASYGKFIKLAAEVMYPSGMIVIGLSVLFWRTYWTDRLIWKLMNGANGAAPRRAIGQFIASGWRKPYLVAMTSLAVIFVVLHGAVLIGQLILEVNFPLPEDSGFE